MRHFLIAILLVLSVSAFGSHYRAGEIVYRHIQGLTYEITVYTYTKTSSSADSPVIEVLWGDNTTEQIGRSDIDFFTEQDAQRNIYVATHTYTGPGTYTISFSDRYRNADVLNIDRSDQVAFYTESTLVINPFITSPVGGNNNSVQLLYPPLDEACLNEIYAHNPLAYDPDGDSLAYSLIPSRGLNGEQIPSYVFPNQINGGAENTLAIDPFTGELIWNEPKKIGEYNLAIKVEEYRDGLLLGYVVRDMQINVRGCANRAPKFTNVNDTCIEAGKLLNLVVDATDPDDNNLKMTAYGYALDKEISPASFEQISTNPAQGIFNWQTTCKDVRKQRHQVLFRADDQAVPERLIALSTFNINVVAPAPKNPNAMPNAFNILLNWDKSICNNAIGYNIYRRVDTAGFTPDVCEIGVPEYTGYELIASADSITKNTYTDETTTFGTYYCYMVTAIFPDGAESYASEEFCAIRSEIDIPVLTKVSVGATSAAEGRDSITWFSPINLDTTTFLPPYQYQINYIDDSGIAQILFTSPTNNSISGLDTTFIHNNINTENLQHTYTVEIISNGTNLGFNDATSSIFLKAEPTDNAIILHWNDNSPWRNFNYHIFQKETNGENYNEIGSTTDTTFTVSMLNNGSSYCFYIVAEGAYDKLLISTSNHSQTVCATPIDNIKPCTIPINVEGDCDNELNTLTWDNANDVCATTDDVLSYNIYFAPQSNLALELLSTVNGSNNTSYIHTQENSIAGCYAISTVDSVGNESILSPTICVDNCPEYKLPNVFTPNGDGVNDTFKPINAKFIASINLSIFNRWGDVVFTTTDKNIGWDGKDSKTGNKVADGVYQYIVKVGKLTVNGIVTEKQNGFITIKSGKK